MFSITDVEETGSTQDWVDSVRDNLLVQGYATWSGPELGLDPLKWKQFEALQLQARRLPLDPTDRSRQRKRQLGRFVLLPWCEEGLSHFPVTSGDDGQVKVPYYQPARYNAEDGGVTRWLPGLEPLVRDNPLLDCLVKQSFAALPEKEWLRVTPVAVGVHLIALAPSKDEAAVASPNHLHQDGEPYTFAFLLDEQNVTGGENYIAESIAAGLQPDEANPDLLKAKLKLSEPLDGYVVDDETVAHHVCPVTRTNREEEARRVVMLLDFTPLTA